VIPLPDFKAGKSNVPYEDRYNKLVNLINTAYTEEIQVLNSIKHGFTKKIDVVKTHIVKSLDAAQEIFHQYLSKGLEGVIIKNKKSIWEDSRSKEQIKLKAEKVCELRVIGWNYGTVGTKNEFRLGSLLCASEDNKVVVNISGFSDDERDTITKENSLNKIVSVLYNERITKKAGGADSLFLPRIVEFREDKDFADKSEDIK
jgi:ATP-dependent DNA ligase